MNRVTRSSAKAASSNAILHSVGDDAGDVSLLQELAVPASPSPDLAGTQRRMFSSLLEPLSGRSRAQTELPPEGGGLTPQFRETAALLIRDGYNLSALEGLELYHRQYWFRLLDSLEEDFPGLRRLLGERRFWTLLESYLSEHPSRSYTLRHLGRAMPQHAVAHSCVTEEERPWVAAVADIEYAFMESAEAVEYPRADPDAFLHGAVILQPHVRLIEAAVPAAQWLADENLDCTELPARHCLVAVWRTAEGDCVMDEEDPAASALLNSFREAGSLVAAIARADLNHATDPSVYRDWFTRWQSRGWFGIPDSDTHIDSL